MTCDAHRIARRSKAEAAVRQLETTPDLLNRVLDGVSVNRHATRYRDGKRLGGAAVAR